MNTSQLRNQVKQYIDQLSPDNLRFINDFLGYLIKKESEQITQTNQKTSENNSPLNALELAGDLVGCLEAPEDLSTNKEYLRGFGE
jgi:hypothetical protein